MSPSQRSHCLPTCTSEPVLNFESGYLTFVAIAGDLYTYNYCLRVRFPLSYKRDFLVTWTEWKHRFLWRFQRAALNAATFISLFRVLFSQFCRFSDFILLHRPIVLNPSAFRVHVCCQYLAVLVAIKIVQISVFPLSHFHLVIYDANYHLFFIVPTHALQYTLKY